MYIYNIIYIYIYIYTYIYSYYIYIHFNYITKNPISGRRVAMSTPFFDGTPDVETMLESLESLDA
jgi:hypothetical protein